MTQSADFNTAATVRKCNLEMIVNALIYVCTLWLIPASDGMFSKHCPIE